MEEFSGPWLDRRTGKTIIVRDAIQDGDSLIIITSEGQIPTEIFQQYFVKMSEEDYGTTGVTAEVSGAALNAAINQGIDAEDRIQQTNPTKPRISLDTPIGNDVNNIKVTSAPNNQQQSKIVVQEKSLNYSLIEKVMSKHEDAITIEFNVNKNEWPVNELRMLIDTFDVPTEEICDYIIDTYLDKNTLMQPLKEYLTNALEIDK